MKLRAINAIWQRQPDKALFVSGQQSFNWQQFSTEVERYAAMLKQRQAKSVALLADNSMQWVLVDFACQLLELPFLPLPGYFTPQQLKHSVETAGCDLLLTDNLKVAQLAQSLFGEPATDKHSGKFEQYFMVALQPSKEALLPPYTAKITFTSGSTGEPKGVCLSQAQQWQVASSLKEAVNQPTDKHLCLLPLATLLENVAGIYAAMLNGTTVVIPSLAALGFSGSSSLNFADLLGQISKTQPSSLITTPEILSGLVIAAEQGWPVPNSLKFVAVGGARVAPGLTARAEKVGIPSFQGYGLSECASVVSLNTATANKTDTAGQILPHHQVSICDGEVMIHGQHFLGYAGDKASWGQTLYPTGDMGSLDNDGYLTITGRKKNLIISSFGRNINPEWVESELLSSSLLRQAFVFGDGQPYCVAALNPINNQASAAQIDLWLEQVNALLPDYAQVKAWFLLSQPVLPDSGLLTANGRAKRTPLFEFFKQDINRLYQQHSLDTAQQETTL